jgi:hypothetical protein
MSLTKRLLLTLFSAALCAGLLALLPRRDHAPERAAATVAQDHASAPKAPATRPRLKPRPRPPKFAPPPSLTHRPDDIRTIGDGEAITRESLLATGVADPELKRRSDEFVKLWQEEHPDMLVVETRCYGEGCISELEFDGTRDFDDFVAQFRRSQAVASWKGQFSMTAPTIAATGKVRSAWYLFKSHDFIERAHKQAQL